MTEKHFYSKAETRKRLGVGRTRYAQLIESEILAPPIKLTDEARPVHTETQILNAVRNIDRKHTAALAPTGGKKIKPLSEKLLAQIL